MRSVFKATIVAIVAMIAISCEIAEGNVNALPRKELEEYAAALYRNHVLLSADMVDLSIELDAYISMTDEQKAEDTLFCGKVHELSEGVYQLLDEYVTCVVDTGGESVWDEGAEWTFIEYNSRSFVGSTSGRRWNAWITDEVKLTFNADTLGEAILMVQSESADGSVLMALKSRENGVNTWSLSVQGTDMGSNGLRAEYGSGIGTGGISLKTAEREDNAGRYSRSKHSDGVFYVDIYDGSTKIDWVIIHLRSDSSNIYETSR